MSASSHSQSSWHENDDPSAVSQVPEPDSEQASDETSAGPRYQSMTTPTDLEELAKDIRDEMNSMDDEGPAPRG
ncbi:hypothetical protein [Streptomyces boninensis]|uniref:hypothetical protein n=1 Tax=Streptomyces boninensis TaxID=2039455 RepID=UPI003B21FCD3